MSHGPETMRIIIGLGNPGEKYKSTRHNAGFMVIDALAAKYNLSWQYSKKLNAEVILFHPSSNQEEAEEKLLLVKPQIFMNNSGRAVQAILSYYKLLPKKLGLWQKKDSDLSKSLTVIHDDVDIVLGKYKISIDSRSAGHKGIESIINHLKTKKIKRLRVGIRTEFANKIPTEKFVLQKFSEKELKIINNLISENNLALI